MATGKRRGRVDGVGRGRRAFFDFFSRFLAFFAAFFSFFRRFLASLRSRFFSLRRKSFPTSALRVCIQAGIVAPRPRPTGAAGMAGASSFFLGDSERLLRDDRLRSRSLSLLLLRLRRRRERDGIVSLARAQFLCELFVCAVVCSEHRAWQSCVRAAFG